MYLRVSVIICSRNRASRLWACLDSFANINFPRGWELIVVNNGSTDNTADVIKEFSEALPNIIVPEYEPVAGLARARNRGVSKATGDVLVFTDDDCYASENLLDRVHSMFLDEGVDYGGGKVLLYDPNDPRIAVQELNDFKKIEPYSVIIPGTVHGANMAFRRDVLLGVGGFDERLGAGTYFRSDEDTDVLRRLSEKGFTGMYSPEIVIYHHHGHKTDAAAKKHLRGYQRGVGAGMMKHSCHPAFGNAYRKTWYWRLRRTGNRRRVTEIFYGLVFLLIYGPSRNRIWNHPRKGLEVDAEREFSAASR